MSSFQEVAQSSETIVKAWAATQSIAIAYDNVEFVQPNDAAWCRTYVVEGDSFNTAISTKCIRRTGLVIIQLYTPSMIGSRKAREYADGVSGVFTNVRDGDVQYLVAYATRVGYIDKFYQLNVSVPFEIDEVLP